jgi:3-methylcrotonyl-CoA carboxylase alpha subunit
MKYRVSVAGQTFEIEVLHSRLVQVNGRRLYVNLDQVGGLPLYSLSLDDEEYLVFVEDGQQEYQVEVRGRVYPVDVESQLPRLLPCRSTCSEDGQACLVVSAPLAGHLVSLPVGVGERLEAGQVVAVVESMKMQMKLTCPQAGVVEAVHALAGQDVGQGDRLVTIQPE